MVRPHINFAIIQTNKNDCNFEDNAGSSSAQKQVSDMSAGEQACSGTEHTFQRAAQGVQAKAKEMAMDAAGQGVTMAREGAEKVASPCSFFLFSFYSECSSFLCQMKIS